MILFDNKREVFRWSLRAGLCGFCLFYLVDILYYPQYVFPLFLLRTILLSLFIVYGIFVDEIPSKYINLNIIILYTLSCWTLSFMCFIVGEGFSSPYWIGIILLILSVSVIAEMTVVEFSTPIVLILIFHLGLLGFAQQFVMKDVFISVMFILVAGVLGFNLNYIVNRVKRQEVELNQKNQYFVKVFAHDIKNRLSSGILNLELLKKYCSDEETIEKAIEDQEHLSRMVNNLINVFSEKEIAVSKVLVPVDKIVAQIRETWKVKFEAKKISFLINHEGIKAVYCDYNYMELVWDNLISNAYQNTLEGGFVTVTLYGDENHYYLSFVNSGDVIAEEFRAIIFEKYLSFKQHTPYSKGLGLNYSRMMSHLHGGTIEYDVNKDNLNEFIITLPREKAVLLKKT